MPESLVQRRVPRVGYAYTLTASLIGVLLAAIAVALWRHNLPALQYAYLWTYLRYGLSSSCLYLRIISCGLPSGPSIFAKTFLGRRLSSRFSAQPSSSQAHVLLPRSSSAWDWMPSA